MFALFYKAYDRPLYLQSKNYSHASSFSAWSPASFVNACSPIIFPAYFLKVIPKLNGNEKPLKLIIFSNCVLAVFCSHSKIRRAIQQLDTVMLC